MPDTPSQMEDRQPASGSFPFWLLPLAISWCYAIWQFNVLPASVPVHWNGAGQVDRYGGPAEAAFLLPAIMLVITTILFLASRKNNGLNLLSGFILAFMLCIQLITGYSFMTGHLPQLALGTSPVFAVLPLVLGWAYAGWLYTRLPQSVPMHWNLAGEVDRYGGRVEGAFLLPAIFTVMLAAMFAISKQTPLLLVSCFFVLLQVGVSVAQLKYRQ